LGGVFSQTEGFTTLGDLWGPMAFHLVCMVLGTYFVGRPARLRLAAAASAHPDEPAPS